MGKDYYALLGIPKTASEDEIKKGYRTEALKWHPDKIKADATDEEKKAGEERFKEIGEAYDVLRDKDKKAIYDQYGEEGLKGQVPGGGGGGGDPGSGGMGGMPGGFNYTFTGDPNDIFAEFFKDRFERANSWENQPFAGSEGGMPGFFGMGGMGGFPGFGGMGGMGKGTNASASARPAVFDLNCSLEDLYNGTTKKMKIKRKSETLKRNAEAVLEIEVKAGWKAGTKITFPGEGDELGASGKAQDVVFVIREKKHATFTREGANLMHRVRIPLVDALTGFQVDVPTLDNRVLRVNIRDMVKPTYSKVVSSEGMPSSKSAGFKGDLIITFDVAYPRTISDNQKEKLKTCLPRA